MRWTCNTGYPVLHAVFIARSYSPRSTAADVAEIGREVSGLWAGE
jgi:hypothetical protein